MDFTAYPVPKIPLFCSCLWSFNARMTDHSSQSLDTVVFRCTACKHTFECAPQTVLDAPEYEWHPFAYQAACPKCGETCAQAAWHRNLMKGWANATGPKTAEGKAAVRKNLEGHPTPEETRRTRFNALKHGMNARTATYFPAKPDGYPACRTCTVDREYCRSQPACVKQTQLFMLHHAAFEQRDPRYLTEIYADMQAAITAIVQQILQTIVADGVVLRAPAWKVDQEGNVVIGEYLDRASGEMKVIYEVHSHPLIRSLQDFLSKNGLSLADMGMTPKVIEQEEQALGHLKQDATTQQSLLEYSERSAKALENLSVLAQRANERKQQDPVLIEYRQQNGDKS